MGNTIIKPQNQPWTPNIPLDEENTNSLNFENNVNQPHPGDLPLRDLVIQFAIPVVLVTAMAIREKYWWTREHKTAAQHEETVQYLLAARQRQEKERPSQSPLHTINKANIEAEVRRQMYDDLIRIEGEEALKQNDKVKRLEVYDKGLEQFLDIRCSWVKKKERRMQVEDELLARLHSNDVDLSAMMYPGVRSVIKDDARLCGNTRADNGRLRHVYAHNWRLQLDLEKHKAVLQRLKLVMPPPDPVTENEK